MIKETRIENFDMNKLAALDDVLKKYTDITTIILYGSRVTGHVTCLSDIDLFYLSTCHLSMSEEADILYDITVYLKTTEVDFADIKNMSLKKQYEIITGGKLLYCMNEEILCDYKEQVIINYLDFKPLYDEYFSNFRTNLKNGVLLEK